MTATDDDLTAVLRAADPARHLDRDDLAGADRVLLEEIVDTAPVDPLRAARLRRARRTRPTTLRSRLLVPVASAAALTALIGIPVALQPGEQAPSGAARPSAAGDAELPVTQVEYAAAAVRVAKANPRVLVTAPGWAVRTVEGFDPDAGEMTFQFGPDKWYAVALDDDLGRVGDPVPLPDGPDSADKLDLAKGNRGYSVDNAAPRLEVTWGPRESYRAFRADRAGEPSAHEATVLGARAVVVDYTSDDHASLLPPEGGVFLELRGTNLGDEEAFLRFVAEHVGRVDVPTWLAAMPAHVVTADGARDATRRVLADIPVPPDFDRRVFAGAQALDSYQFGARLVGPVVCGWVEEWKDARSRGDQAAATAASEALASSRDWKVLVDMDAEGDYPEVVWDIADEVGAGVEPAGYRGALGCS